MQQLSGFDATFLALESSNQSGHVASLAVYDAKEMRGNAFYSALRRTLRERIPVLPPLRRRLVDVPFKLDSPYWADDPDLDLDYHLRRSALPSPGTDSHLEALVARLHAQPLDRARPLWEMTVIEGLEGERVGVYTKLHHATVDGMAGIALLQAFSDSAEPVDNAERREPEPLPGALEMLARGAAGLARRPGRAIKSGLRVAVALTRCGGPRSVAMASGLLPFAHAAGLGRVPAVYSALGLAGGDHPPLPATPAPRTPWNRKITKHRRWAGATVALDDVHRVRKACGASVNDVVLAIAAHALRTYLDERAKLPADPLIAMVPVSLRSASETAAGGNQVTMTLADLATDEADPVARLLRIHRAMRAARHVHEGVSPTVLTDLGQIGAGLISGRMLEVLARTGLLDRMRPAFNVTISNVPGPRETLSLGGAPMEAVFPVSVVAEGQGLNVTALSYRDRLHFGLTSCRTLVPDLANLARGFKEGLEALRKRVDAFAAQVEE
jgi:WS/DGAT/MGAT family acyltransferase